MKRYFKLFAMMALAAITLVSCSKNDQNIVVSDSHTVNVTVNATVQNLMGPVDTKTYIGDYNGTPNTIIWGENEYMTIMLQSGESSAFATSDSETANSFNGKNQATFKFAVEASESAESYIYGGVYPASCAVNWNAVEPYSSNTNASAFKVSLPSIQNATSNSYDPDAYIMVAMPTPSTEILTEWMANYRRATALNKVTLTNIPEDIVSVEFTAPEGIYMAGRRYIDLTTGESGELYGDTRTETLEVKASLSGDNKVVWFTSWETAIPAGSKLKIVAKSASKKYTREIEARTDGINFKEGYLNTLKVNMASADVDDIDDLSGDYLILSSYNNWQIMANYSGYDYFYRVESSIPSTTTEVTYSDFADIDNIEIYIWTVSEYEGGYSLKNNGSGKYLNLDADDNYATESDNPVAFSLTISDDNVAVVRSNTYSERVLMYNSRSPRFAFYKGTQNPIYFIKAVIEPRCADPVISYNEDTDEVTITCATEGAKIAYTLDGTDPTTDNNGPTGNTILYEGPFTISGQTTVKAISGGLSGYLNSYIVTQVCGSLPPASDGTILWAESFSGFSANDVPSASNSQTTVYGDGILTYICDGTTKVYSEALAGGSSPELLVSKSNGSFTVSDIPTGAATTMTLTFKSNHTDYFTVSSTTTGITISDPSYNSGIFTVTITAESSVDHFSLTFTNTNSSNARVDDFNLVVGVPAKSLSSIEVTGQTINYTVGATFSFDGIVTATYSDGTTANVTSSATISEPDMSTVGNKTITVSYTENDVTKTTSYTITVKQEASSGTYSMTPNQESTGTSATSYITTLTEFTYNDVSWKMNQWNPSSLQIKTNQASAANEFRFYNTSAFPGKITKVVITFSAMTVSDPSKLMFVGGSSEISSTTGGTAGTWDSTNKTLTWTPSASEDFTYFAFYQDGKAASGTNKLATADAIVVTYE